MNRGKPTVFIRRLGQPSRGWLDDVRIAIATEVVLNGKHIEDMSTAMCIGPNTLSRFVSGYPATTTTLAIVCDYLELTLSVKKEQK